MPLSGEPGEAADATWRGVVERLARTNDLHAARAAEGLISLIDRGLVVPTDETPAEAVRCLRDLAAAYRVGR